MAFLGSWLTKTETNPFITSSMVSLTPSLSLRFISAPSLTRPSIVYWLPSSAAVCSGVCWERERDRERENKSTSYDMRLSLASLQTVLQPANTSLIWWTHGCSSQECKQRSPSVTAKFHWQIAWPPPINPNQTIPFIGSGSIKFLGMTVQVPANLSEMKSALKTNLEHMLKAVDAAPVTRCQKLWLYKVSMCPRLTWLWLSKNSPSLGSSSS